MKIFCIDNNYAENNKERKTTLKDTEEPVLFLKADSCLTKNGKPFFIPDDLGLIGYGAHLAVRICRLGKSVPERFAHRYYDAFTVGIDFTATGLLDQLRREGRPWDLAKSFDGSAAIGDWVAKDEVAAMERLTFRLDVNGQTAVQATACEMLHSIDALVSYVSRTFTLKTGDLLFTGMPVAYRPAAIDDHLEGWIEDRKVLDMMCK